MRPATHHVLDAVIDTFDTYLMPEIDDEYAASLALTVSQLLRSVRVRIVAEPRALWEDNADLANVLEGFGGRLPHPVDDAVAAALEESAALIGPVEFPGVDLLMARADILRGALVAVIEAVPDADDPVRVEGRGYLRRQLTRQEPWLVDAWTGPRR